VILTEFELTHCNSGVTFNESWICLALSLLPSLLLKITLGPGGAPPLVKEKVLHSFFVTDIDYPSFQAILPEGAKSRILYLRPSGACTKFQDPFILEQCGASHIAKRPDCLSVAHRSSLPRRRSLPSTHLHHTRFTLQIRHVINQIRRRWHHEAALCS